MKLGFIGCGKMGSALMRTLAKDDSIQLLAFDSNKHTLEAIKDAAQPMSSNEQLSERSDIVFLCVKPQDLASVLDEIEKNTQKKLVISIAAGIPLSFLEKRLPDARCVRVMPNIACLVGEMAAGYSIGKNCSKDDKKSVSTLLNRCGVALEVKEDCMDAITALSGSGPAFVAYLIEAFEEAARREGLSADTASKLAIQTFFGSATLLKKENITPKNLIEMVSSPNGTTIAGRSILENSDIREVIRQTLQKAAQRSKELVSNA